MNVFRIKLDDEYSIFFRDGLFFPEFNEFELSETGYVFADECLHDCINHKIAEFVVKSLDGITYARYYRTFYDRFRGNELKAMRNDR